MSYMFRFGLIIAAAIIVVIEMSDKRHFSDRPPVA